MRLKKPKNPSTLTMDIHNCNSSSQLSDNSINHNETLSSKRFKQSTRDRLSELPDLALVHILSHLYFEEAARTSVLSKRFNALWNSVSILNFSDQNAAKTGEFFVSFVNTALGFHRRKEIEKFSVEFNCDVKFFKCVDEWIKFAVSKKVKSLWLNLIQRNGSIRYQFNDFEHKLPKFLYDDDNLVELVTSNYKIVAKRGFKWKSLKLLSISRAKTTEELISRVLSDCPVLETLELKEWSGFDKIKINSSSLKVLRLIGELKPNNLDVFSDSLLEISGPRIVSLEVSGALYRTRVRVSDVGSLVDAVMVFEVKPLRGNWPYAKNAWYVVRDQDLVREVLECLCLVKALTLGGWCIKAVSTCEAYNLSSPWSERQSLTLCLPVTKWDHRGVAALLQSSPHLETLIIRPSCCNDMLQCAMQHASYNTCDEEYYWKSWSTISKCSLLHLKTVEVSGFRESCGSMKPLFQFLEFLLRNSTLLEEIVIHASSFVTQGTLNEALKLLDVPTASPDAIVQFEPPRLWVDPFCISPKSV